MAQHKTDEKIMRYKLEAYQKKIPDFMSGNLTSIEILGRDEDIKLGPNGIAQKEEVQTEEPQDLKSGATQEEEIQIEKP